MRPNHLAKTLCPVALALLATACGSAPQGDAPEATSSESQDLYGLGSLGQAWPGGVVPVCYSDTTASPALQALIPPILAGSWSTAANITFTGFGSCPSGNHVTVTFQAGGFRGNTSSIGYGTPTVTLISDDTTPGLKHFIYEVIHEFGHALGFVHEMQRPDNWVNGVFGNPLYALQCPPQPNDYGNYAEQQGGLYLTSTYDGASIMNYCDPLGNQTDSLSAGDVSGVKVAYGAPVFDALGTATVIAGGPMAEIQLGAVGTWASPFTTAYKIASQLPAGVSASLTNYGPPGNALPSLEVWAGLSATAQSGFIAIDALASSGAVLHETAVPYTVNPCPAGAGIGGSCCLPPDTPVGGVCVQPCCSATQDIDCTPVQEQVTQVPSGSPVICTGGQGEITTTGPVTCGGVGAAPSCTQQCTQPLYYECACPSGEYLNASGVCVHEIGGTGTNPGPTPITGGGPIHIQ